MCGIAGILTFDPRDGVAPARLRRMGDVLAHRGPDGEGAIIQGQAGLAHRRLAIIDVAAGQQPMCNEDGTIWIVFNGEIYNHAAIRAELQARGHQYRTRCDTETILHLYEDEGERAPERLHGMFAFAIWDGPRRRLVLGRDRLGIKPLYVSCTDRELLFGSEIKAILAADGSRPALDERMLPSYLATGFVAGEDTLFTGIKRLLPGHTMTWDADSPASPRTRRYWQLPAPASAPAMSFESAADDLRERLLASVKRHLMSDVPLGVFLSGGLDSSAIAAIASRMAPRPLRTFSVGFLDKEANELAYARQVSEWIGSEHHDIIVSPDQFFEALPRLIWHEDEPIAFPSSVPLHFVSRLAGEHVKVVLTGEGADELFLGYNRYRVTHWNARLGQAYWSLTSKGVRRQVQHLVKRLPAGMNRVLRRTFLGVEPDLRHLYFDNFAVISQSRQRQLLSFEAELDPYARALDRLTTGDGDLLDRMGRLDLDTYLHELLMKQDQMSMAASIESRVPFLDDDIIEHVSALPSSFKVRGWQTKALLRAAVSTLVPPAILSRKKMGFPVPVGRWLRGDFQPLVNEFVLGPRAQRRQLFNAGALTLMAAEHASGAARHGDRLWNLINLEIWQRIFHDGESPEHVMSAANPRQSKAA